jgi:hypothetical protein
MAGFIGGSMVDPKIAARPSCLKGVVACADAICGTAVAANAVSITRNTRLRRMMHSFT